MKSMTLADALLKYRPHRDLAAASLIDKLASALFARGLPEQVWDATNEGVAANNFRMARL